MYFVSHNFISQGCKYKTLPSFPSGVSILVTFCDFGQVQKWLKGEEFRGYYHHVRDANMARVLHLLRLEVVAVDSHVLVDQRAEVDGDCR